MTTPKHGYTLRTGIFDVRPPVIDWFTCSCGASGPLSDNPYEDWKRHCQAVVEKDRAERIREAAPVLLGACKAALAALESPEARHVLAFTMEREMLQAVIAQVEEAQHDE